MISTVSRASRLLLGKPLMAVALVLGSASAIAVSPAVYAQEEEQPEIKLSKGFQKSYTEIKKQFDAVSARQDILDKVNAAQRLEGEARAAARAELAAIMAEEIATLRKHKDKISNQSDRFTWGFYASQYGVISDNPDLRLEGIVEETASGLQTRSRKAEQASSKGLILFDRGDFAGARESFEEALDLGSSDANLRNNIIVTYLRENNRDAALAYYDEMIEAASAAGKPDEVMLARAFQLARELERPNANDYAFKLARFYPDATNWSNAIVLVRSDQNLSDEAVFDLQRLMLRTGSFREAYDVTTFVRLGNTTRRPQEILDAIDAGVEAGFVNRTDPLIADAISESNKQLKIDETELAALDADARAPDASLVTATVAGDAFLNYGQPAKAEELYRIALTKPNANSSLLMTRIGIAQLDQGLYEDARTTFAAVAGNYAKVASLWSIYAAQAGS